MTQPVRLALIVCAAVLASLAPGVRAQAPAQQPQDELASPRLRISWDAFKKLYDAGAAVVIDVRDTASYENGHIPGARSIPLTEIEKQIPSLKKLSKPIVLYCA